MSEMSWFLARKFKLISVFLLAGKSAEFSSFSWLENQLNPDNVLAKKMS